MAELIMSSRGPHRGPGAESYFDFEPGNEAMLEAIETFFARRSGAPEMQEAYLAELCAKSIDETAAAVQGATFFGWLAIVRNLFHCTRDGMGSGRIRGKRRRGNPGNGPSSFGNRRRFSFA